MEPSSASGSQKRARAHGSVNQVPSCLVDGCMADLSKCRDYHRRHKVCEVHSKTSKVTIRGVEQRFCQQCSRFHSLAEFDDGKRSCRKRLDGHNRRRRKPQPDSIPLPPGRFLPNQQGARFLPFSSPQVFPTTAVTSAWAEAEIQSQISFSSGNNVMSESSSGNSREEKQFPFLHSTAPSLPCVSASQPHFGSSSSTGNCTVSSRKMFSHGSNPIVDSSSALSLLSPQPAGTLDIGHPHTSQAMIPNLHYTALGMGSERTGSVMASDGRGNTHLNEQGVLRASNLGSTAGGSHQTLSFSWE